LRFSLAAIAALTVYAGMAASQAAIPFETSFKLSAAAEVIATFTASCDQCAWDVEGREAVMLVVSLDGRYVTHLPLVRQGTAAYGILIGRVDAGDHKVSVRIDSELTAIGLRNRDATHIRDIQFSSVSSAAPEYTALSLAPILYARPNTIGRFTDAPVFMWYEREATPRGTRYRYSVVFTNEDGGTPTDRLMATWGRTTDIEYVYSVEVDPDGKILADDIQGPHHEILTFHGTRLGRHPLLWVATDNNMVRDTGTTSVRYALAPVAFSLDNVSREAVMDANPWLYALAAQELAREKKIVQNAPPGGQVIPDPRRYVYVEACGEVGDAAIAFEVGARSVWERSDRGVREYRIQRDGCFRGAVPVSLSIGPQDIRGLRIVAYPRYGPDGTPRPAGTVRIDRINTMFMLDDHHMPGPSLLRWTGPASVKAGAPLEIPVTSP
jgi:hypothetical protein